MPTVMLTTTCQNSCAWCFARSKMEHYRSQGVEEMSWQDFLTVVEYYERSGYRQMNLLGGEPTLHSQFIDMLTYLASRGFSTLVVTNGIIPAPLVDILAQEKFQNVQYAVNSTSYFDHGPDTRQTIDRFLRAMPHATSLSYTIAQRDVRQNSLHPILDRLFLIMRFGLRQHLQFQIAVPSHGNSDFVPFDQYGAVVELLQTWTAVIRKNRVSVGLDCHCMPACRIPPDAQLPFPLKSSCTDFMVDIGPNLEVWPCFPLSAETFRLEQLATLAELRAFVANLGSVEPLLYESGCTACEQRLSKACDGGCRGFQIVRKTEMRQDNKEALHVPRACHGAA
jgi:organic radical activating enzyme